MVGGVVISHPCVECGNNYSYEWSNYSLDKRYQERFKWTVCANHREWAIKGSITLSSKIDGYKEISW